VIVKDNNCPHKIDLAVAAVIAHDQAHVEPEPKVEYLFIPIYDDEDDF
jgi:hypothetical protein